MSFTEAVAIYMNKQIAELAAIHTKRVSNGDGAAQEDLRKQAWIAKWDYSQVSPSTSTNSGSC